MDLPSAAAPEALHKIAGWYAIYPRAEGVVWCQAAPLSPKDGFDVSSHIWVRRQPEGGSTPPHIVRQVMKGMVTKSVRATNVQGVVPLPPAHAW